jgi:hypothetical protein
MNQFGHHDRKCNEYYTNRSIELVGKVEQPFTYATMDRDSTSRAGNPPQMNHSASMYRLETFPYHQIPPKEQQTNRKNINKTKKKNGKYAE